MVKNVVGCVVCGVTITFSALESYTFYSFSHNNWILELRMGVSTTDKNGLFSKIVCNAFAFGGT